VIAHPVPPEVDLILSAALLTALVVLVFALVLARSILTCILLMSTVSLVMAIWLMVMDAPDVAFTEAAVGAGVSTMILLGAALTSGDVVQPQARVRQWLPVAACLATLLGLGLVLGDLPTFGDPAAPANAYVGRIYLEQTPHDIGAPNVVTAVLASYRGFDTLGETSVIFAAGIGVMLLLGARSQVAGNTLDGPAARPWGGSPVLSVGAKLLIPIITLYAFYVLAHGELGAGGGFQAGVILATGVILHALVFGLAETERAAPPGFVRGCAAIGVLIYAGAGLMTIAHGGRFLDYDALLSPVFEAGLPSSHLAGGHHHWGQRLGILTIETGVLLAVAGTMITLYYAFAGRTRDETEAS
jgi:multicomponent Na+:H+ antiporter subunit B